MKRTTIFMATLLASTAAVATPVMTATTTTYIPLADGMRSELREESKTVTQTGGTQGSGQNLYMYPASYGGGDQDSPHRGQSYVNGYFGNDFEATFWLQAEGRNDSYANTTVLYTDTFQNTGGKQRFLLDLDILMSRVTLGGRDSGSGSAYREIALSVNGTRVSHERLELVRENGLVACQEDGSGALDSYATCASMEEDDYFPGYFDVFAEEKSYTFDLGVWEANATLSIAYSYDVGVELSRGGNCESITYTESEEESDGDPRSYVDDKCVRGSSWVSDPVGLRSIATITATPAQSGNAVPEPASLWLAALGGVGLIVGRRRRNAK